MSTAIKFTGAFTNRAGMRQLIAAPTAIAGAVRDYAAQTLSVGTLATWPEMNGGVDMTTTGSPTVVAEDGLRFLRFSGSGQWAKEDTVARAQPHTIFVRYRLQGTPIANGAIVASALGSGVNFSLNTTPTNVQLFAGTALSPTVSVMDTNWHSAVLVVNGASSVLNIDGIEKTGSVGAQNATGLRLAAGALTPSIFTRVDIARVGIISHAADATERAAILAELS